LLAANEGRDRLEIQSTEICTEQPEEEKEEEKNENLSSPEFDSVSVTCV